jgi:hypothetical protein
MQISWISHKRTGFHIREGSDFAIGYLLQLSPPSVIDKTLAVELLYGWLWLMKLGN